jgi:dihydrofolate reductase
VPLTQYYTATSLDGFIAGEGHSLEWLFTRNQDRAGPLNYDAFYAGVGAVTMGSTTYEWILDHEGARWPYDEVIVYVAPVTLGAGAPLLPRRVELRLEETARNGDFVTARYAVVSAGAEGA